MRFGLSIIVSSLIINIYAGNEMPLINNIDSLYQIKYDVIYWGGIRINTIQITKRQKNIILEAIVNFSNDKTNKKNRYNKYMVDDTVWNQLIQIMKSKNTPEPISRPKKPIKRDVSSRLQIYVKENDEVKYYMGNFDGDKIIRHLNKITYEKTDIFHY
jgi:hypothetical protein